jgi:NTE family protein
MTRRIGLVLPGGGARAAYEVGVVHYIVHQVARELGRDVPIDVVCGTSAGAINACSLAAYADEPKRRAVRLAEHWRALRIDHVLRPDASEIVGMGLGMVGLTKRARSGGVVDVAGLRRLLESAIAFERIGDMLKAGHVSAVSLSTTNVGSGNNVVFVQRRERSTLRWDESSGAEARSTTLRLEHALASAAIPFLFPAVQIDGQLYCDGALRQNVPLSPARRLGADVLIVVSPHHLGLAEPETVTRARENEYSDPKYLLGKTLNALLLDRLDGDLDRLDRVNQILAAGAREYGAGFLPALNRQLAENGRTHLRPVESLVIRPSQNVSLLAADFLRSSTFLRARPIGARIFRRLVDGVAEADLASYLLFDGAFAAQLIELGQSDARARHAELAAIFERALAAEDCGRVA